MDSRFGSGSQHTESQHCQHWHSFASTLALPLTLALIGPDSRVADESTKYDLMILSTGFGSVLSIALFEHN